MPPAAELVDATKKYGEVEALKGITIRIELGEVVAQVEPGQMVGFLGYANLV